MILSPLLVVKLGPPFPDKVKMRLFVTITIIFFSSAAEASFIKWCQDKLTSKSKNKSEIEQKIKASNETLRTIEQVLELTKYELDRPVSEIQKINQAKELYYKISELHLAWSEKDTLHGMALKSRNLSVFGNQRKNVFYEMNSDLNQNKENIEKITGGFELGDRIVSEIINGSRHHSELSESDKKLFSEIALRHYIEYWHSYFSQVEDLGSLHLLEVEKEALIAKLSWLEKRKELLDLANSVSGVEIPGNDELEEKIKENRKQLAKLTPRIDLALKQNQKGEESSVALDKMVKSLITAVPALKNEFIYSTQIQIKSKVTGDIQIIEVYIRGYDDKGNRKTLKDVQSESSVLLESIGLRSF